MKRVIWTALCLISAGAASAQTLSVDRVLKDVQVLASDEFEGRGVATRAEDKTVAYIADGFKTAGFLPGAKDSAGKPSYFQDVALRRFRVSDPALSFTLPDGKTVPVVQGENMTVATRGATADVTLNAPLVFVGYGVTAPERGWDDFKGVDVKGKIIVVLINDPDFVEPALKTFNGKAMTYYGRWTYKYEEAARRGAVGAIIIHDTDAAAYGWATVKNSNTRDRFDIVRAEPLKVNPALESWIQADTADALFTAAGLDLKALRVQARSKAFKPVELKGVTLSGTYKVTADEIHTRNVVAVLPGKTKPDEYVLYSAHWDHLGIGNPDATGDKIFNGAFDNATGVAGILELARAFARAPRTDRSIVMISFTAEESGLLGSEYYASNPLFPLDKTVGGVNIDGLNIAGKTRNIELTGYGQSTLEDMLAEALKGQKRVVTPDQRAEAGLFYRSDHFPMAKRGVPMLFGAWGLDMVEGGLEAGKKFSEAYIRDHYHQPSDEYEASWDMTGGMQDLEAYYALGRKLATAKVWPEWKPGSEFKAVRDKSAKTRK
ncbi:M28 family metallopeptidase [Asticcacaulis sp. BYS171W]|uniref:M28 family metallopeptidase n=1 Tax=Asticcacaulis aquaticus TaxID=2984212 RepID=A0ABT5HU20_9CAUL|nr:M28 family metallopeptidase [Asticcacaulis aquaticus]MDC7683534.1 M28 family metallopeptidase [Asticcacaulis aquaticus]